MTTPPVTLAEFRAHLNMSQAEFDTNEAELVMHLEAATENVEGRVGPIVTREVTESLTTHGGRLFPAYLPVVSVTSITDSGDVIITDAEIDDAFIISRVPSGSMTCGTYAVVYEAGRGEIEDIPADLKLAVMVVAEWLWETQRGTGSTRARGYGASSGEAPPAAGARPSDKLPARADVLLARYTPVVFA